MENEKIFSVSVLCVYRDFALFVVQKYGTRAPPMQFRRPAFLCKSFTSMYTLRVPVGLPL